MGKLIKTDCKYPLAEVVGNIDSEKFWIPITEEILIKNGWELMEVQNQERYYPVLPQVYNEELGDWVEQDEDFESCCIYYWEEKGCWCYKYEFGTFVYDVKSIGELEIILGREGFVYEFDI